MQRRAFTIVELMVVIAIIAILLSLTFVGVGAVRRTFDESRCLSNIRQQLQGLTMLRADTGLLPFTTYLPREADGSAPPQWLALHARWSEAMGVPPSREREGVKTSSGKRLYEANAPWKCPRDKSGAVNDADFGARGNTVDKYDFAYSYAEQAMSSCEYWPSGHMTAFHVRGRDAINAQRVVTQAYEAFPTEPVIEEVFNFHRRKSDSLNATLQGFLDGSAGPGRRTQEQSLAFGAYIVARYPPAK